ncbi:hypothetical protein D9619_011603 [Psilocybe cf. subviscida]|uniref:Uncharacterized protein n=1 Tax=Psilocybe cf. subviscida TaxID=2480587 RepID=A0A8H5F9K9_9AGAR|nr:hypothetical protein D9619_011603 [Psilocybe cf. subviscida]
MSSPSLPRPPQERAAQQTTTGLRSPVASYTSITSLSPPSTPAALPSSLASSSSVSTTTSASASSISLCTPSSSSGHYYPRSPPHQRYTSCSPRTPPRSSTTTPRARASPLLHRLLQPFVSSSSSISSTASAPTSPTYISFVNSSMALHQPTPRTPASNSSTMPPTSSEPRPASRSERLLRDALQRDEMERKTTVVSNTHQAPQLPPASSSSTPPQADKPTHRRRHSHASSRLAATLNNANVNTSAPRHSVDVSPERERRTRDRSERDEQLTRGGFLFRTAVIGGSGGNHDDPRSLSPSPTPSSVSMRAENQSEQRRQSSRYASPPAAGRAPATYAQSHLNNARSTSHSPSPMRRQRPSALPLSDEGLRRHKTVHTPTSPPAHGGPLLMTPHEQALRARLERVLVMSTGQERTDKDRRTSNARRRSESRSGNEVRDEQGGRPWQRDVEAESSTSGPLYSAPSNKSGGSAESVSHTPMVIPLPRTGMLGKTHNRNRSKTDPASPPAPSSFFSSNVSPNMSSGKLSGAPSPRRSSTVPSAYASRIPTRVGAGQSSLLPRTGTTPPLVTGDGDDADVEECEENDAARLMTPPPTPPFTARIFSFGASEAYFPSPYKTTGTATNGRDRAATVKGSSGAYALGSPRRPRNAPISGHLSNSDHHRDADESSSCSSSPSQASFPASEESSPYRHRRAQSVDSTHPNSLTDAREQNRPTFNARKASAHCQAMEGYVSFANVEGLGAPMDLDCLTADDEALMAAARARAEGERGRGVFGASWAGWRKLLGTVAAAGVGPTTVPASATAAATLTVQSAQGEGSAQTGVVL